MSCKLLRNVGVCCVISLWVSDYIVLCAPFDQGAVSCGVLTHTFASVELHSVPKQAAFGRHASRLLGAVGAEDRSALLRAMAAHYLRCRVPGELRSTAHSRREYLSVFS